jgi:hypothetical protein
MLWHCAESYDRCDLIIIIMCDLSVLSPEQRRTLLTKFHGFLKQGARQELVNVNNHHQGCGLMTVDRLMARAG